MPVYEFRCNACGKEFQILESIKDYDPKKVKCTKCGSSRVGGFGAESMWLPRRRAEPRLSLVSGRGY